VYCTCFPFTYVSLYRNTDHYQYMYVIFLSTSRQIQVYLLKLGHDRFLTHLLHLIVQIVLKFSAMSSELLIASLEQTHKYAIIILLSSAVPNITLNAVNLHCKTHVKTKNNIR
jgi:hypothetical protein